MNLSRWWWGLGVVIVLAALVVCLVPGHELPGVQMNDKVAHIIGHALMAMYFAGLVPRSGWWKIFLFLLMFGICVEFAQYYMKLGRNGDPRDVLGNCLGALIGLLLARLGVERWPQLAAVVLGQRRTAG